MNMNKKITVMVPATSANMGSGFDSIGIALDLWNELTITPGDFTFNIHGEGEQELPKDESNLIYLGVKSVYDLIGKPVPSLKFFCTRFSFQTVQLFALGRISVKLCLRLGDEVSNSIFLLSL